MSTLQHTSYSFDHLKQLSRAELKRIHQQGICPDPFDLNGTAKGIVLDPAWFERLHLWRGKVFHASEGVVGGFNRIGVGTFEYLRYRFYVTAEKSAFDNREVILINHDVPENPYWVRIFHDELVEIAPKLYLASSHLKVGKKLRYISYFAFDFNQP